MLPNKVFVPELGQAMFGQPFKYYDASNLLLAALEYIRKELRRVYWNIHQKEIIDPFDNTGCGKYKNDTFEVVAYSWDDEKEQPYNFKWRDVEISWYKYLGRGVSVNQQLAPDKINELLEDCLRSLEKEEEAGLADFFGGME